MAGGDAITTKGTGKARFPVGNISFVQCIIFTEAGTDHAIGTAVVVDIHPERIHKTGQVHNSPNGAVRSAMHHPAFPL